MRKIIICLLVCVNAYSQSSLLTDINGYWRLDESSGNAIDATGYNNGTVTGATQGVSGHIGNAYSFNGSSQFITLPDNARIQLTGNLSIGAWVKVISYESSFIAVVGGETGAASLVVRNNGAIQFVIVNVSEADQSTSTISVNNWHYILVTFNTTANTGTYYINGSPAGTFTQTANVTNGSSSNIIGTYNSSSTSRDFNGLIDEVGMWSRVLTTDEASSLYNGISYPFVVETRIGKNTYRNNVLKDRYRKVGSSYVQKNLFRKKGKPLTPPPLVIDYYKMYDGVCPDGYRRDDDYDCAKNDFSKWSNQTLKHYTEFISVVYIDPMLNDPSENGTIEHPYNAWSDISSFASNTAYVQKANTVYTSAAEIMVGTSGNVPQNVLLGAYGSGPKPIVQHTGTGSVFHVYASPVIFSGLEVVGVGADQTGAAASSIGSGIRFRGGGEEAGIIYNCVIRETGYAAIHGYHNLKLIADTIYRCYGDAIFGAQFSYAEISHCWIDSVNRAWFVSKDQDVSSGDCYQVSYEWDQVWVHDSYMAKTDVGNKAVLQMYAETDQGQDGRLIIERNRLLGNIWDTDSEDGVTVNIANNTTNVTICYNHFRGFPGTKSNGMGLYFDNNDVDSVYGNVFDGYTTAMSSPYEYYLNNTFVNNTVNVPSGSGGIFVNNLFDGGSVLNTPTTDHTNMFTGTVPSAYSNSFTGFANFTDKVNRDYTLDNTSDAINQGTTVIFYKHDITGKTITGATDIGAYEKQ